MKVQQINPRQPWTEAAGQVKSTNSLKFFCSPPEAEMGTGRTCANASLRNEPQNATRNKPQAEVESLEFHEAGHVLQRITAAMSQYQIYRPWNPFARLALLLANCSLRMQAGSASDG